MVFGADEAAGSFLNLETLVHPHYLVRNNKQRINNLTEEIRSMIAIATDKYTENKLITLDYQNKNRIEKRFNKNDYVFVLDRMQIPGNTRPLLRGWFREDGLRGQNLNMVFDNYHNKGNS